MEKRSIDFRNSKRVEVVRDEPAPKTIRLVLQKNMNLKTQGSVTKNIYMFYGAGYVLDIDERDVPELLQKGANDVSCCGGGKVYPYFAIAEV